MSERTKIHSPFIKLPCGCVTLNYPCAPITDTHLRLPVVYACDSDCDIDTPDNLYLRQFTKENYTAAEEYSVDGTLMWIKKIGSLIQQGYKYQKLKELLKD